MGQVDFQKVWSEAVAAYRVAHEAAKPPVYEVGEAKGFFGNEIDRSKPVYQMEGLCGFAWVNVGDGRSAWAKWVKANQDGYNDYYGGISIWSSRFMNDPSQSVERKLAGCKAAAAVIESYGLKASAQYRLD